MKKEYRTKEDGENEKRKESITVERKKKKKTHVEEGWKRHIFEQGGEWG